MFYTESDGNSYPAEKRVRCIGGRKVVTWGREITSCNMLEVEAGTNGYQGGDTGHGSRTYLRLKDLGGTDMECHVEEDKYGGTSVEIVLGGDTELETMKESVEDEVIGCVPDKVSDLREFAATLTGRLAEVYRLLLEQAAGSGQTQEELANSMGISRRMFTRYVHQLKEMYQAFIRSHDS